MSTPTLCLLALLSLFATHAVSEAAVATTAAGIPTAKEQQAEAKSTTRAAQEAEPARRQAVPALGAGANGGEDESQPTDLPVPSFPAAAVSDDVTTPFVAPVYERLRPLQSRPLSPRAPPSRA